MEKENLTPTQQLAEEIITALIDTGLIDKVRKDELLKKIMAGNVKSEDWALWVDTAMGATDKGGTDGQ